MRHAAFRIDKLRATELGLRRALLELDRGGKRDAAIALSRLAFANATAHCVSPEFPRLSGDL